jgi:hypothetical protein
MAFWWADLAAILPVGNDLLNTNGSLDSDGDRVLSSVPSGTDLLGKGFGKGGQVEVGLLVSSFVHEGDFSTVFNVDDFPVRTVDNGDSGTVGRGNHIFILLAGEDIGGDKVALGVTVLSSLGDGDGKDLAGLTLDHHETAAV